MKIAEKINEILNLQAQHAYFFHQGDWYHHLKRFPGVLIDSNGFVKFQTEADYKNSPFLVHGQRLHVPKGISEMPDYIPFNEQEIATISIEVFHVKTEEAIRRLRTINEIIRNPILARQIKNLYQDTCQICKTRLIIGDNLYYSEVHHIRPLGTPHNGPDIIENMICVCPNCHVKLDYRSIQIDKNSLFIQHQIDQSYVDYHNNRISITSNPH